MSYSSEVSREDFQEFLKANYTLFNRHIYTINEMLDERLNCLFDEKFPNENEAKRVKEFEIFRRFVLKDLMGDLGV